MKRGVLLILAVLLLSACTSSEEGISYPKILSNDFMKQLMTQNTVLRQNITDLNDRLSQQEEDVNLLNERIDRYNEAPKTKDNPYDWIKGENIIIEDNRVLIELENATISSIADTHSLEPLIHKDTNVIEIVPLSIDNIHLGDIAAYQSQYSNGTILHRVVFIGYDDIGWYATMKGDNNPMPDPGKIRFNQIQRIVVAIIY